MSKHRCQFNGQIFTCEESASQLQQECEHFEKSRYLNTCYWYYIDTGRCDNPEANKVARGKIDGDTD